jgi:hypothetical protein
LLADGAVLVPAAGGAQGMVRLEPGHPQHASWLVTIQQRSGPPKPSGGWLAIAMICALILPFVGVIVAIVHLIRGRWGAGLALMVATGIGVMINLATFA